MQSMCHVYAAVSYICIGDAESSSLVKFPLKGYFPFVLTQVV